MIDVASNLKLFYSYASKDSVLRSKLETSLSGLSRQYNLVHWHDREIPPGKEREHTIDEQIDSADIILLLISPDFIASDHCYNREMQRALGRHKAGTCYVIPILLRPIFLGDWPFSDIKLFPTNSRAVSLWRKRDEAFCNVAEGVGTAIKKLVSSQIGMYQYFSEKGYTQKNYSFRLSNGKEIDKDILESVVQNMYGYGEDSFYLDTQTGKVVCASEIEEDCDESEEELEEADDSDRYIFIRTRVSSHEAYQWMEDFVGQIVAPKDERLSDILFNELEKTKPFRRFKGALAAMDEKWIHAWYEWENYHFTEVMNEWFESLPETIRETDPEQQEQTM
jgi:hypothetical protein